MKELVADQAYNPVIGKENRGLLQVDIGSGETVTIKGSINGTVYVDIETATTDILKEIALPTYIKYSVSGGTASKVYIDETR